MDYSAETEQCSESCNDPSDVLDIAPLTEITEASADAPNEGNQELESFRQRWKQELQAGTKWRAPEDGATAPNRNRSNLNNSSGNGSKSSSKRFNATSVLQPTTPLSKQNSYRRSLNATPAVATSVNAPGAVGSANVDQNLGSECPASADDNGNNKENNNENSAREEASSEEVKEQQARQLYVRGVELERAGQLYEAIQQYRRAMQLVPDIESRGAAGSNDDSSSDEEEEVDGRGADASTPVSSLYEQLSALMPANAPVCQPNYQQQSVHLSALPCEIVEQVLRWVVSSELDVRSLNAVAATCRGLYLLTRAEALWKTACQRVWGLECKLHTEGSEGDKAVYDNRLQQQQPGAPALYGGSWRMMYLTRPQPRYNGCYISKTSYFRSGECNFHDQNYQPWHLVSYYRFIRFFPGGVALMLTTSEAPQTVVGHLANRDPRHAQVLVGHFCLEGSIAHLEFHRFSSSKRVPAHYSNSSKGGNKQRRRGQGTTDVSETTLKMSLELQSARRGGDNWFLCWRSYVITSLQLYSGVSKTTEVDVTQLDTFPQLAFSRVKSYAREATEPV